MSTAHDHTEFVVLLVEDNPGDVRLTLEILKEAEVRNRVCTVQDGVEAMEFLRRQGAYADAPRPDLVLLDLNLPRRSGHEVLEEIRKDPELALLPVVVLTTSSAETDILGTYRNHANCYITKPIDLEQFVAAIRSIESFWLKVAKLPR